MIQIIWVYNCWLSLTHHGLVNVVLQRVDQQIPHRLPGSFGLLCPGQPQVELVHGALQLLEALQGSLHLTLPASHVCFQTLPPLPHLACLPADGPSQPSGLLFWGKVWERRRKKRQNWQVMREISYFVDKDSFNVLYCSLWYTLTLHCPTRYQLCYFSVKIKPKSEDHSNSCSQLAFNSRI